MIRAFCFPKFAHGRIDFGSRVPAGATIIARGPEQELRDFIAAKARLCTQSRWIGGGRGTRVPGTEYLAVPGIPEADSQAIADRKLTEWVSWIAANAPGNIRVLPR